MGKCEAAKILESTKARAARACDVCGATIEKGEQYLRESLGRMMKPPGVYLRSFCKSCCGAESATGNNQ
jgi:hypothetical protein